MSDLEKDTEKLGIRSRDLELAFTLIRDFSARCVRSHVDPRAVVIAQSFNLESHRINATSRIPLEYFARLEIIGHDYAHAIARGMRTGRRP